MLRLGSSELGGGEEVRTRRPNSDVDSLVEYMIQRSSRSLKPRRFIQEWMEAASQVKFLDEVLIHRAGW